MSKGNLIIVSGPSGVGKGTVLSKIYERDKKVRLSVSATTRSPREGEVDGVHYHFISKEQFEDNIKNGKMLEYASYVENYYGTLQDTVEAMREAGIDVILEIETQGALQVMDKVKDALSVFILPPSEEELENRLRGRGTESEEKILGRLNTAKGELKLSNKYKYNIVNDDAQRAADELYKIITDARIQED